MSHFYLITNYPRKSDISVDRHVFPTPTKSLSSLHRQMLINPTYQWTSTFSFTATPLLINSMHSSNELRRSASGSSMQRTNLKFKLEFASLIASGSVSSVRTRRMLWFFSKWRLLAFLLFPRYKWGRTAWKTASQFEAIVKTSSSAILNSPTQYFSLLFPDHAGCLWHGWLNTRYTKYQTF